MTERTLTNGPVSAHRLMTLEQPARAWRRALPEFAQRIDLDLFRRISRTAHPAGDLILPKLSHAANHSRLWMGMAAALAAFGGRFGKRAALRGMLAVGAASFLSNIPAKLAFRRARPQLEVPIARRLARIPLSTSFPSGHAASAFAFATGVSIEKPQLAPVVFPLAGAVAYSRIYTGVHYPTDVVVGAAIGAGVAMATRRMWPATDDEPASTRPSTSAPTSSLGSDGLGLTVIVNPTAGSPLGADVAESLRASLPNAKIVELSAEDDLSVALAGAVESCAVLGIAGGDGSVNAAAAIAVEHERPLLVVPAGTLNHFARDLGINSVEDAVSAVQAGSAAEVDVSSIGGEVFVNTASVGAYVDMVEAREQMEGIIGKWPAVLFALVRILRNGQPVHIELDGTAMEAWMIFFGNCRYTPAGFAPSSRPKLDDGLVDVRIVHASHPYARLRLTWAVLTGTLAGSAVYRATVSSQPIRIHSRQGPLSLSRDGEMFDGPGTFTVEKLRNRLIVVVPDSTT